MLFHYITSGNQQQIKIHSSTKWCSALAQTGKYRMPSSGCHSLAFLFFACFYFLWDAWNSLCGLHWYCARDHLPASAGLIDVSHSACLASLILKNQGSREVLNMKLNLWLKSPGREVIIVSGVRGIMDEIHLTFQRETRMVIGLKD